MREVDEIQLDLAASNYCKVIIGGLYPIIEDDKRILKAAEKGILGKIKLARKEHQVKKLICSPVYPKKQGLIIFEI